MSKIPSFGRCKYEQWTIPLGVPEEVEVTGVSQSGQTAETEFSIPYRLNEIGLMHHTETPEHQKLGSNQHLFPIFHKGSLADKKTTHFKLFDDGWRFVEP